MPVVLTDYTNRTWAVEQPNDGLLHVGYAGKPGPRLLDALDFIESKKEQFHKFVQKRQQQEAGDGKKRRSRKLSHTSYDNTFVSETGGVGSAREV